jgi:cytochrome c oxidase subunit 4
MLRSSVIRAPRSSAAVLPSTATRQAVRARVAPAACLQQQTRQAHAISNPTLANIEKRWEDMPPQEQADLWMSLRDRMKVDWKEMTLQEKKAGVYAPSPCHCELQSVAERVLQLPSYP